MARDFFGRDQKDRRDDDPEIRVTDRRRIQLDDDENADLTRRPQKRCKTGNGSGNGGE